MDTKKWEALLEAAELGSFTRAAVRLGLTQSGLTHMMNSLEKEVGLPLLCRDRYGVRLTESGERLLPAIQELLRANAKLDGLIAAEAGRKRESVRVAAYSSVFTHWLPTIVQQFRWACPEATVDIRMGSVDEVYRWLQEGKVDVTFASRQDRGQYDWVPLWDDPLLAILPPDWPAEDRDSFPVSAFEGKAFLMPSMDFDQDILRVFDAQGVQPDIRENALAMDAEVVSMVERGQGASILSQLVLQGRQGGMCILPLDPPASRHMGVAVLCLEEASPTVRKFIDCSRRIVTELHRTRGA